MSNKACGTVKIQVWQKGPVVGGDRLLSETTVTLIPKPDKVRRKTDTPMSLINIDLKIFKIIEFSNVQKEICAVTKWNLF